MTISTVSNPIFSRSSLPFDGSIAGLTNKVAQALRRAYLRGCGAIASIIYIDTTEVAGTADFAVVVPAKGEAVLTYSVHSWW